jgi:hypothetical protein
MVTTPIAPSPSDSVGNGIHRMSLTYFLSFAMLALCAVAGCGSGSPACTEAVDQLCAKACSCAQCAVNFGGGFVSQYGNSEQACVAAFSPCGDPNSSFSPQTCSAAVAAAKCASTEETDGGVSDASGLLAPGCLYEAN